MLLLLSSKPGMMFQRWLKMSQEKKTLKKATDILRNDLY